MNHKYRLVAQNIPLPGKTSIFELGDLLFDNEQGVYVFKCRLLVCCDTNEVFCDVDQDWAYSVDSQANRERHGKRP